MGECGGVCVSIEYLRYPNTRRPASPHWPIAGTDGRTEAVCDNIRSYCRGKVEVLVRSDALALSRSPITTTHLLQLVPYPLRKGVKQLPEQASQKGSSKV